MKELLVLALLMIFGLGFQASCPAQVQPKKEMEQQTYFRKAKETLTPIEMNRGDTLKFELRNGEIRTMVLHETNAEILLTNLDSIKKAKHDGGTLYHFTCKVSIDGQPMTMERYVCSQESFYEPYVLNGMRIWFDGVEDIFDFITEDHGECKPGKHARFAVNDLTDRIAPVMLRSWYPNDKNFIDIADTYNGDDCWMGPYQGADAHGGLDINQLVGTPGWAPIDFDDHYFFNSLEKGDNNNRWRGFHTWPNGDLWTLQTHHVLHLITPEHTSIKAGTRYLSGAGVWVGDNNHSHYVFRVATPENDSEVLLDPWIIFWQIFEDNKERAGDIKAFIQPLEPTTTGKPVSFSSKGSRNGPIGQDLFFYWTFGNGGWSNKPNPTHRFVKPGVYPVTLTINDGAQKATFTQHISVSGQTLKKPALALETIDALTFRNRPLQELGVYGKEIEHIPHTLHFLARQGRPEPKAQVIRLKNIGGGNLKTASTPKIRYRSGDNWLALDREGAGNDQQIRIRVNATGLKAGTYSAMVSLSCPGALNATQGFMVELIVPSYPPSRSSRGELKQVTVDDTDPGFYSTPYFWVGHRFKKWKEKGYKNFYLTNGGRSKSGEFGRFTPDLVSGKYQIFFHDETPFEEGTKFAVKVRHKDGEDLLWMEPANSRMIGTFEFREGKEGYVEVLAEESTGQVLLDAVTFKRIPVNTQQDEK
jgi:PKD repeat protein